MTRHFAWQLPVVAVAALVVGACHRGSSGVGSGSTATPAQPRLPANVTAAMIAQGDTIFNTNSCQKCHRPHGIGGRLAPNLTDQAWVHIDGSYDAIVKLVTTGFTKAEQ